MSRWFPLSWGLALFGAILLQYPSPARAQYVLGQSVTFIGSFTIGGVNPGCQLTVQDDLSSDLTYTSCSGAPCSYNAGVVSWDLGTVTNGQSGNVTVTAVIHTCNVPYLTDQKIFLYSSPATTLYSNVVTLTVACATNTPTATPTLTRTPTVTNTPTITYTPTITDTPTITPTATPSGTPTWTGTPTDTGTPTSTATITFTPTWTSTATDTPTPTDTPVPLHVWPNPFNPAFAWNQELIAYQVPPGATLSIYTLSGELVIGPLEEDGTGHIYWKYGLNAQGKKVSGGIYYYVIRSGNSPPLDKGKLLVMTGP